MGAGQVAEQTQQLLQQQVQVHQHNLHLTLVVRMCVARCQ